MNDTTFTHTHMISHPHPNHRFVQPPRPPISPTHNQIPFRSYHRDIIRTEPLIYRLEEAMLHYGQGACVVPRFWMPMHSFYLLSVCIYLRVYIHAHPHPHPRGEGRGRRAMK